MTINIDNIYNHQGLYIHNKFNIQTIGWTDCSKVTIKRHYICDDVFVNLVFYIYKVLCLFKMTLNYA